jgi:Ser/Thr protein kinase RdoA (MazF antagonist)
LTLPNQAIEAYWPLTAVSLQRIQREPGQRAISVITAREGRFVAKVSDQWRSDEVAQRHAAIFDFLRAAGFAHAPALLKTRTGCDYQVIDGQPVYVLEFVRGRAPSRTPAACRRLGEITGALHLIAGYPHGYLFTVADVMPELFDIADTLPFAADYAQMVRALPDFGPLPVCLIHGEILGNCVETPGGRVFVIDWDEAGIGTRVLDVGNPLLTTFLSEDLAFEEENARAFYRGYFSKVALTPDEVDRVFDAALFYALRYVIYGNTDKRWRRIQFAVNHRQRFESLIGECAPPPGARPSG